jgi:hypothetical protein
MKSLCGIALGGDIPDGTDGIVELLANLLQILRLAGFGSVFQVNGGEPPSCASGQHEAQAERQSQWH